MVLYGSIIIALGANLSSFGRSPLFNLKNSISLLNCESLKIHKFSKWYQTPAFPAGTGPDFVNGAISAKTSLSPTDVLQRLAEVENQLGRERHKRWSARVCDLDLVSYDNMVSPSLDAYEYWKYLPPDRQRVEVPTELILPHPRIEDRPFVLVPMRDVAPTWIHPVSKQSIDELIAQFSAAEIDEIKLIET